MSLKDQLSQYTKRDYPIIEGDIYVSVSGSDESDGSREHPFATIERAVKYYEMFFEKMADCR